MTYELVDTTPRECLWIDKATREITPSESSDLLAAITNAAITAPGTDYIELAQQANPAALTRLPAGALSGKYERERARYLK